MNYIYMMHVYVMKSIALFPHTAHFYKWLSNEFSIIVCEIGYLDTSVINSFTHPLTLLALTPRSPAP
jgi:hypothetical protein